MTIDWILPFGTILSAFVVAIGWVIAHILNSQKDFRNKKREIRVSFLMEAYQTIASSANRETTEEEQKAFENAVEKIQFLGTKEQLKLLTQGIESRNFTPLLEEMRNDIRNEFKLESVPKGIKHFRFDRRNNIT